MGNIISYLEEYGEYTLRERPFSDEDALVLAQFSYLKLEGAVPYPGEGRPGVTIGEISRRKRKEEIFADTRFAEQNSALFEAMRRSRRFQTMVINDYENQVDTVSASQFSAVTCFLEDDSVYIAYRGTDETLAGWKEDFRMACRMPVKSQELSVDYLNRVASACRGALVVGGHSKGGNLAVYASMFCEEAVRERIRRIYNLDGPGFLTQVHDSEAYRRVENRIRKIVPHSSVVGMMLEDSEVYEVVESSRFGVLQHDPFTWVIREGRFATAADVYRGRRAAAEVINRWIQSLTEEELEHITDSLFAIVGASEAETLLDFSGNWKCAVRRMASALHDTGQETKRELWKAGRALCRAAREALGSKDRAAGGGSDVLERGQDEKKMV